MNIVLFEHPRMASEAHYHDVANAPLHACLMTGYIAALLRERGFNASIYDAYLADENFEKAYDRLTDMDCSLLGVHAVYFWEHTSTLLDFVQRLKAARPDIMVIFYGIFPSFHGAYLLCACDGIDAVIVGEPEHTFLEAAQAVMAGKVLAAEPIAGLVARGSRAARRQLIDPLEELPFPVRHPESLRVIGGSILGSRGCCGACSFCCINPFYGHGSRWRGRTPDNIAREISALLPLLKDRYIYFLDADFFGPPAGRAWRVVDLSRRLKEYNLAFGLEARSGVFDEPMIANLSEAGLRDVFLGIESGSARSLARMNKRMNLSASRDAVRLLRAHGVNVTSGFIMFEADSTLEDVRENFEFLLSEGLLEKLENTANVLYHREICLRSMPNFSRMLDAQRLSGFDPTGYEGYYRFGDPAVQFLADLMARVCRSVLKMTELQGSALWWKAGDHAARTRVNEYLVAFFKEQLERVSRDERLVDDAVRCEIEEQALREIEGLRDEAGVRAA